MYSFWNAADLYFLKIYFRLTWLCFAFFTLNELVYRIVRAQKMGSSSNKRFFAALGQTHSLSKKKERDFCFSSRISSIYHTPYHNGQKFFHIFVQCHSIKLLFFQKGLFRLKFQAWCALQGMVKKNRLCRSISISSRCLEAYRFSVRSTLTLYKDFP